MSLKPFTVLVAILAFCNGQINVTTRRIQLSPDGKTMTIKSSGTGADRQDDIRVYEKRNPEAQ